MVNIDIVLFFFLKTVHVISFSKHLFKSASIVWFAVEGCYYSLACQYSLLICPLVEGRRYVCLYSSLQCLAHRNLLRMHNRVRSYSYLHIACQHEIYWKKPLCYFIYLFYFLATFWELSVCMMDCFDAWDEGSPITAKVRLVGLCLAEDGSKINLTVFFFFFLVWLLVSHD